MLLLKFGRTASQNPGAVFFLCSRVTVEGFNDSMALQSASRLSRLMKDSFAKNGSLIGTRLYSAAAFL